MNTKRLYTAAALAASALLVVACGGSSSSNIAPASEPEPTPVTDAVSSLTDAAKDALRAALTKAGEAKDTLKVQPGKTVNVAGVKFACNSAYPCTITIKNTLGPDVAEWKSKHDKGKMAKVAATFDPPPVADSGTVSLLEGAKDTIRAALTKAGKAEDTLTVPPGETEKEAGVEFKCNSAYPCTVTLKLDNSGAIVATWASQHDAGKDESTVSMGSFDPLPLPPVADSGTVLLSEGAKDTLKAELTAAGESKDTLTVPPGETVIRAGTAFTCNNESAYPCTITFELDNSGTITANWESKHDKGEKESNVIAKVVPPQTPFREWNDPDPVKFAIATDRGGSVETSLGKDKPFGAENINGLILKAEMNPNKSGDSELGYEDVVTEHADKVALTGWDHKVMFADWGDTTTGGDGGYETGALVYSDLESPTKQPFDSELADRFANPTTRGWFTLTSGAVSITHTAGNSATDQTRNIKFDPKALPSGQTTDVVSKDDGYDGEYFGAKGEFVCTGSSDCKIERDKAGSLVLALDAANDWTFAPDDGEKVTVPDQDWMAFGVWATTPDDKENGKHWFGTFREGKEAYVYTNALKGKATYSGGAAGVYVDQTGNSKSDAGFFTAKATLYANFDVNGDGNTDDGDHTLGGLIENFKDDEGFYLGSDTKATPNDPKAGGDSDWSVRLVRKGITDDNDGDVSGSADGVGWEDGSWKAQLYGPGGRPTTVLKVPPSGVAGKFNASSGSGEDGTIRRVAGAFGAKKKK